MRHAAMQAEVLAARDRVMGEATLNTGVTSPLLGGGPEGRWELTAAGLWEALSHSLLSSVSLRHDRRAALLRLKADPRLFFVDLSAWDSWRHATGGTDELLLRLRAAGVPTRVEVMWVPVREWDPASLYALPARVVGHAAHSLSSAGPVQVALQWYVGTAGEAAEETFFRFALREAQQHGGQVGVVAGAARQGRCGALPPALGRLPAAALAQRLLVGAPGPESETAYKTRLGKELLRRSGQAGGGRGEGEEGEEGQGLHPRGLRPHQGTPCPAALLHRPPSPCSLQCPPSFASIPTPPLQTTISSSCARLSPSSHSICSFPLPPSHGACGQRVRRPAVRLSDFAGMDAVKEEVQEVITFLRDPSSFQRLGARPPRGVLITGGSGVGKSSLALAIAAEARVPVVDIKSSDVDPGGFVGQGAANVRELFKMAREMVSWSDGAHAHSHHTHCHCHWQAPMLILMEDFEEIGGVRGAAMDTRLQDKEAIINQLLVELDGSASLSPSLPHPPPSRARRFPRLCLSAPMLPSCELHSRSLAVQCTLLSSPLFDVVIRASPWTALTPHARLAPPLRRPGRMDRVIEVPLPTAGEREKILRRAAAASMDPRFVDAVAEQTGGLKPTDLRGMPRRILLAAGTDKFRDEDELAGTLSMLELYHWVVPALLRRVPVLQRWESGVVERLGLELTPGDVQRVLPDIDFSSLTDLGMDLTLPDTAKVALHPALPSLLTCPALPAMPLAPFASFHSPCRCTCSPTCHCACNQAWHLPILPQVAPPLHFSTCHPTLPPSLLLALPCLSNTRPLPSQWDRAEKLPHAVWAAGRGVLAALLPSFDRVDNIWLNPNSWEGVGFTRFTRAAEGSLGGADGSAEAGGGGVVSRAYTEQSLVALFGSHIAAALLLPWGHSNNLATPQLQQAYQHVAQVARRIPMCCPVFSPPCACPPCHRSKRAWHQLAERMVMEWGWGPDDSPFIFQTHTAVSTTTHHAVSATHHAVSAPHHAVSATHHAVSATHHAVSATHHAVSAPHHAVSATHHAQRKSLALGRRQEAELKQRVQQLHDAAFERAHALLARNRRTLQAVVDALCTHDAVDRQCMGAWVHGHMAAWVHERMGARVFERMGA
ncbi:unnamed protein product [Closterium sp. Naga37s-1]|nr:unnamed protein product [Closterium sp. Naga37s-1]